MSQRKEWYPLYFQDDAVAEIEAFADAGELGDTLAVWEECLWERENGSWIKPIRSVEDSPFSTLIDEFSGIKYFSMEVCGVQSMVAYVEKSLVVLGVSEKADYSQQEELKITIKKRLDDYLK